MEHGLNQARPFRLRRTIKEIGQEQTDVIEIFIAVISVSSVISG